MEKREPRQSLRERRKNNRQLRLSKQNELLSERLMLQYQLDTATTCDWTWFGNHLLQLGMVSLKKQLTSTMSRKQVMMQMADRLKKGSD